MNKLLMLLLALSLSGAICSWWMTCNTVKVGYLNRQAIRQQVTGNPTWEKLRPHIDDYGKEYGYAFICTDTSVICADKGKDITRKIADYINEKTR